MSVILQAAKRVVATPGKDLYIEANIDSGPLQLASPDPQGNGAGLA